MTDMSEENSLKPKQQIPDVEGTDDAHALVLSAHKVLVHYLPGASLPSELSKVRALLDAHMFGRDNRTQRDDVVRVARQIDSLRASRVASSTSEPSSITHYKNKKTTRSR